MSSEYGLYKYIVTMEDPLEKQHFTVRVSAYCESDALHIADKNYIGPKAIHVKLDTSPGDPPLRGMIQDHPRPPR